jgi:formylglycine-generating enzyme required for sulfatase activity
VAYYNRAGEKLIFGGLVGSGGEADVYRLDSHPQFVVKKYHAGRVPPVEKLLLMLKKPPADPTLKQNHVSIAWISDLLYDQKEQICGYVMPEISEGKLLFNSYNPSLRRKHFPGFSWKHLHRTARNLSSAIAAIHSRGYVIGDLNESNILVQADTLITIIDTDSFQVRDSNGKCFRCPVGKAEYTAPEIQRARLSEIDRNECQDRFSLGIILFLLLMEGSHPFRGKGEPAELHERIRKNLFPYSRSGDFSQAPAMSLSFSALHKDLQELFRRCFIDALKSPEKRPSALEWLSALKIAEENLVCCSANPCHYYQKGSHKCIWCERAALMRGTDCFPDPRLEDLPEQEPLLPISVASINSQSSVVLPAKPQLISVQKAPQNTNVQPALRTGTVKVFDGIEFVFIGPGEFDMGSPSGEENRRSDEGPVHRVRISAGFWLGKCPVTQGQWQSVMGSNPSKFKSGSNFPVEMVSWTDVQKFIKKLNKKSATCKRELDSEQVWRENADGCYRLPTEAEWEYAARAGTSTPFWTGNNISTNQANYFGDFPYGGGSKGTYRRKTTPVNNFPASPWGLHDMHGNVWEWVLDWYDASYYGKCGSVCTDPANLTSASGRVLRGGSWSVFGQGLGSAYRFSGDPGFRGNGGLGFRLVLAVRR